MLCILEAMDLLALLTRHTPEETADQRERLQNCLNLIGNNRAQPGRTC